jgi:hypothetical protein
LPDVFCPPAAVQPGGAWPSYLTSRAIVTIGHG